MNLVNGQKFPVFSSSSISQLSEIRMFTTEDEKPLEEIFQNAYNVLEGKPTDFDPKKADSKVLFDLLAKVLPNYDTDRVHTSDAKKLFSWYNILLAAGKLTAMPPRNPLRPRSPSPPSRLRPRPPHRPRPPLNVPLRPRKPSKAYQPIPIKPTKSRSHEENTCHVVYTGAACLDCVV